MAVGKSNCTDGVLLREASIFCRGGYNEIPIEIKLSGQTRIHQRFPSRSSYVEGRSLRL